MSEQAATKPVYTDEQRRAIVTRMFQATHTDLGQIVKIIAGNPTPEGFLINSEVAGEAIVRITRAMQALEKLVQINVTPEQAAVKAGVAKDGALVAGWSTQAAPPDDGLPVMTPAAQADQAAKQLLGGGKGQLVDEIKNITVGTIQQMGGNVEVPASGT